MNKQREKTEQGIERRVKKNRRMEKIERAEKNTGKNRRNR